MFQFIPTTVNFDWLKISRPFAMASTIAVLLSFVGIFYPGLNYGIDFSGGAEVAVKAPEGWDISRLREEMSKGGIEEPTVVQLGAPQDHEFLVKVKADASALKDVASKVEGVLKASAGEGKYEILRADVVGPQAGERLRIAAILSLIYAAIGILVYITFRFDMRFAPGIVRALLLDIVVVVGIWVLLRKEFNLHTIAALLTIAGYSCNDTIVIYDRIREFSKLHPDWDLYRIINRSINLNLGRTIITVLCTQFVVVSLWLFGGPVLADFAFAMFLGFTVSVYSTLFVANPLILYMEKRRQAARRSQVVTA